MMKHLFRLSLKIFIFALATQSLLAQTTAFNYQGKLTDGGNPANGAFQMQFKLFDAVSGGTQIGTTLSDLPVTVTNGVFSVKLDFGANALSGANRWLEIAVRHNSGESYVTLSPREQIASSPYAVRTLSAAQADVSLDSQKLGGVLASEYVTNTSGANSFIRNGTTQQTANFNISGNGVFGGFAGFRTGINPNFTVDSFGPIRTFSTSAAHVVAETTGGTNSWARFYMRSPNRSWFIGTSQGFAGDQFYLVDETAGQTRMSIATNGNVGFGTIDPNTRLTLSGGAAWSNSGWTASMNMQNVSALGWEANGSGQRFGIGQTNGGLYFFRTTSAFGNTASAANYDMVINDAGNVGIGTTAPNAKLSVTGNTTQDLNSFGMPKAMVFVLANGTIARCYNGITGATTNGCGFSVTAPTGNGIYTVNVGFDVSGRFVSAVPYGGNRKALTIFSLNSQGVTLGSAFIDQASNEGVVSDFFLIVY